jgi:hypothetical protein
MGTFTGSALTEKKFFFPEDFTEQIYTLII